MTATKADADLSALVSEDEVVGCEAQWDEDGPQCGKPAEWRATAHNKDCVWETANFCQPCMTRLRTMCLTSVCSNCFTRDLLKSWHRI